jgi:hypothetical protein
MTLRARLSMRERDRMRAIYLRLVVDVQPVAGREDR